MTKKKTLILLGCLGIAIVCILSYFINLRTLLFEMSTTMMMIMEGMIKPIIGILLIIVLVKVIKILDMYIKKNYVKNEKESLDRETLLEVIKKLNIEQLELEEGQTSILLKSKEGKKLAVTLEKVDDQVVVKVGRFLLKKKYYYTYEELI